MLVSLNGEMCPAWTWWSCGMWCHLLCYLPNYMTADFRWWYLQYSLP